MFVKLLLYIGIAFPRDVSFSEWISWIFLAAELVLILLDAPFLYKCSLGLANGW